MTRCLRSGILGCYITSFFEMHIDTDCVDLNINTMTMKDRTVLFHEYIHFLQDFTTYYGLNSIYVYSEYLCSVLNRIYKMESMDFPIPFQMDDNCDNVKLNRELREYTLGDYADCDDYFVTDIQEDVDYLTQNESIDEIPKVILNPEGNIASFGAMAIMENMAYLIERLCSPKGYVKSPDFPYKAAEMVADYYVEGFSHNPLMVLALCDMSLQSSNPGACFVRVMKGIRDGHIHFSRPEEIYDYFYTQKAVMYDGRTVSLLEQFKNLLLLVQNCLKGYIKDIPELKEYYQWIDNVVSFAINWRENDRYFLLNMARQNDLLRNTCWQKAIRSAGTPLMTNNKGHYFKIPQRGASNDGMDVEFFRAIRQIELLFEEGTTECGMYEWCVNSPSSTPNYLCKISPWAKCSEPMLCPYAFLWKHWSLSRRKPKHY